MGGRHDGTVAVLTGVALPNPRLTGAREFHVRILSWGGRSRTRIGPARAAVPCRYPPAGSRCATLPPTRAARAGSGAPEVHALFSRGKVARMDERGRGAKGRPVGAARARPGTPARRAG